MTLDEVVTQEPAEKVAVNQQRQTEIVSANSNQQEEEQLAGFMPTYPGQTVIEEVPSQPATTPVISQSLFESEVPAPNQPANQL